MILQLISQAAGVTAFIGTTIGAIVMWRKFRNEDRRTGAEADKIGAEGQVAISGTTLQWAQRADQRAEKAEARVDAVEDELTEARKEAEQTRAEATRLSARVESLSAAHDSLEARYNQLLESIASCKGGASTGYCPVAESLPRNV